MHHDWYDAGNEKICVCNRLRRMSWLVVRFSSLRVRPIDQPMVSASASVLVGLEFDSQQGFTKTLQIGTAAFLLKARCAEALLELPRTHKQTESNYTRRCTNSVVTLQDSCSYKASSNYIKIKTFHCFIASVICGLLFPHAWVCYFWS